MVVIMLGNLITDYVLRSQTNWAGEYAINTINVFIDNIKISKGSYKYHFYE